MLEVAIMVAGALMSGAYIYGTMQLKGELKILQVQLDHLIELGEMRDKAVEKNVDKIDKLEDEKISRRDCPMFEE